MTAFCPEWTDNDKRKLIEIIEANFVDEKDLFMTLVLGDKSANITNQSCVSVNDRCIIINTGNDRVVL